MIEFREIKVDGSYELVHNNKKVENIIIKSEYSAYRNELYFYVYALSREVGEQLIKLIDAEKDNILGFTTLIVENWGSLNKSQVRFAYDYANDEFYFNIFHDLTAWNFLFDFKEYYVEFSRIFGTSYFAINQKDNENFVELELSSTNSDINKTLQEEILEAYNLIEHFHSEALNRLTKSSDEISTILNFPEELKIPCEQYLLYFAQFLQDLGINATSSLKEEAGKVLFSVTPTDDIEALDKIREALALYLHLPESSIVYDDSFAAMRLQQQIENLQHSQRMTEREIRSSERELRLAQTVIESQDKVIFQKDTIIEQQRKVIEKITSKSIMMDSLENKAEFEKVFDGLEVGESKELKEKLGIKFKPVTFLQSLGRTISGTNDEITSLNLNKETGKESS